MTSQEQAQVLRELDRLYGGSDIFPSQNPRLYIRPSDETH